MTIIGFTITFRIDGVSVESGLFGDAQIALINRILNSLLGKRSIWGSQQAFEFKVTQDFQETWSPCVEEAKKNINAPIQTCGDVNSVFSYVAAKCPSEDGLFELSHEGVMYKNCFCESDSAACSELSNIESRNPTNRRQLEKWPPEPDNEVAASCSANQLNLFVDMVDSYGDGWNDAIASITDANGVKRGSSFTAANTGGTHDAGCFEYGCYTFAITAGDYPDEISYTVRSATGDVYLKRERPDAAPFTGEFCMATPAPTASPTEPPTPSPPTPHLVMTVVGRAEMDTYATNYRESEDVFKAIKQELGKVLLSGDINAALGKEADWDSAWSVNTEEFVPPSDYIDTEKIYLQDPETIPDEDDDEGGGSDGGNFIKDYGLFVAAGVGAFVIIALVGLIVLKFKGSGGNGGGTRHHGNIKKHGGPPQAPRRASKRPSGVNFGAAAAKGVKHHGAPSYGKEFQLV